MPRGSHQVALSISSVSPIAKLPAAFSAMKIASLIFLPESRFLAVTSFQSLSRPSLSFGSSLISLRRQSLSLSRARFVLRETSTIGRAFALQEAPVRASRELELALNAMDRDDVAAD